MSRSPRHAGAWRSRAPVTKDQPCADAGSGGAADRKPPPVRQGPKSAADRPRHDQQRRCEHHEDFVLDHVRREESLAPFVQRRDECMRRGTPSRPRRPPREAAAPGGRARIVATGARRRPRTDRRRAPSKTRSHQSSVHSARRGVILTGMCECRAGRERQQQCGEWAVTFRIPAGRRTPRPA